MAFAHVWGCCKPSELGVIGGHNITMSRGIPCQAYLMRGRKKSQHFVISNREWGYGALDLYGCVPSSKGDEHGSMQAVYLRCNMLSPHLYQGPPFFSRYGRVATTTEPFGIAQVSHA